MNTFKTKDSPSYTFYSGVKDKKLTFIPKVRMSFTFIMPKNNKNELKEKGLKKKCKSMAARKYTLVRV